MTLNIIKKGFNIKDDKGHKIVAAIYLVTRHLSVTDPLVLALRTHAISLLTGHTEARLVCAAELAQLLESAVLIGVIGEKNASIISYEVGRFVQDEVALPVALQTHTEGVIKDNKRTFDVQSLSLRSSKRNTPYQVSSSLYSTSKSDRSDKILSFMKDKKSGIVKDISALFPSVSEKTIQRELGALVARGALSKRGNKRWSVYFYEQSET